MAELKRKEEELTTPNWRAPALRKAARRTQAGERPRAGNSG